MKIPTEFLKSDPEDWENRVDYQSALSVVRSMKVVNDFAEREVALIQNYNSMLTNSKIKNNFSYKSLKIIERNTVMLENQPSYQTNQIEHIINGQYQLNFLSFLLRIFCCRINQNSKMY